MTQNVLEDILQTVDDHVIVSVTDADGVITYANRRFTETSGYTGDELVGQPHSLIQSGVQSDRFYQDMWSAISRGKIWKGEICNRKKDGSFYWIESTIKPFLDGTDVPYSYVAISTDISRAKCIESNLRGQTRLLHLLTEATTILISSDNGEIKDTLGYILKRVVQELKSHGICLWEVNENRLLNTLFEWRKKESDLEYWHNSKLLFKDYFENGLPGETLPVDERLHSVEKALNSELEALSNPSETTCLFFPLVTQGQATHVIQLAHAASASLNKADVVNVLMIIADTMSSTFSHHKAQQQLAINSERLKRSHDNARIGTWDIDLATKKIICSPSIFKLFGMNPKPDGIIPNKSFYKAIHRDDRTNIIETTKNCFNNDLPLDIEIRVVWPDGSVHWILVKGALNKTANGRRIHFTGVAQDIDQRRHAEIALSERDRQLRQAQKLAKMGYWKYGRFNGRLNWSKEIFTIFGRDEASFNPTDEELFNLFHPDDKQSVIRFCGNKKPQEGELQCRIIQPDGSIRHAYLISQASRDSQGKIKELIGTIQDITDRVEAENLLKESQLRFSLALEGTGDRLWELGVTGNHLVSVNLIESANQNMSRSVNPGSLRHMIHPEDFSILRKKIEHYLAGNTPLLNVEIRVRYPEADYRWFLVRGKEFHNQDNKGTRRLLCIQTDIDERKRSEQALVIAREEADRANKAKSEFLSRMSHELRTPMNAILGFSKLMEMDTKLSDENLENVQEIVKAGNHLLGLINEVLDLAKVESGHIDLSLEPVELEPLIKECMGMMETLARQNQVTINFQELNNFCVRADYTRLKQVVINLISNAIKYNNPHGCVTVKSVASPSGRVRLLVEDTGIGMSEQKREELFTPFNRFGANASAIDGTGIGLSISKQLVEMMAGRIDVESKGPGKGSTFSVELPMQSEHDIGPAVFAPHSPLKGFSATNDIQATVLYIEDNPVNTRLFRQLLEQRPNISLLTSHSSAAGIDQALVYKPDLIFMDINMPEINGFEVLKLLKSSTVLAKTPVVAVSASSMPNDQTRAISAGFTHYVTKPFDLESILKVLDRYLEPLKERSICLNNL